MHYLESTPGRTCIIDGKEFLFFSGYAYLGMGHVKEFIDLIKEGIDKYGMLFPSSRISNTRLRIYEELESTLSEMTGMEETVTFSSGFLAGKTISEIVNKYRNVFVTPGTHPAIAFNNGNILLAKDFVNWGKEIVAAINTSPEIEFTFIADAINILQGEKNDFEFVKNIDATKKILFLIDDSHGIGITGKNGNGVISYLPKQKNIEYIICYSLSKAFNIEGGVVSCSKYWADELRKHPNYSGSTGISPALVYAFLHSKNIYAAQRKKLFKNIDYLNFKLNLNSSISLPILSLREAYEQDSFYKKNIIISSFPYPFPQSKKINRIIINALHSSQDINQVINAL